MNFITIETIVLCSILSIFYFCSILIEALWRFWPQIIKSSHPFFLCSFSGEAVDFLLYIGSSRRSLRYTLLNSDIRRLTVTAPLSLVQNMCGRHRESCTAALSSVYRNVVEYIGESGKGGERNMKREQQEKIYETSMHIGGAVTVKWRIPEFGGVYRRERRELPI